MHNYHEIISLHGVSLTGFFTKNAFHGGRGGVEGKTFFGIFLGGVFCTEVGLMVKFMPNEG